MSKDTGMSRNDITKGTKTIWNTKATRNNRSMLSVISVYLRSGILINQTISAFQTTRILYEIYYVYDTQTLYLFQNEISEIKNFI